MDTESTSASQQTTKSRRTVLWIMLAGVPILIIAGVLAYWLLRPKADSETTKSLSNTSVTESVQVTLGNQSVNPATITVKKGQSVTWVNKSTIPRQITADTTALPGLDTVRPLAQNESFTYTFEKQGTFSYYDAQNPTTYNGRVQVQ